jgi:Glycosyltransferase sugar-binding region containing DXD motif
MFEFLNGRTAGARSRQTHKLVCRTTGIHSFIHSTMMRKANMISRMRSINNKKTTTTSKSRWSSSLRQQAFLLSLLAAASLHPLVSFHYLTRNNSPNRHGGDMMSSLTRRRGHDTTNRPPNRKGTRPKNPVADNVLDTPPVLGDAKQFEWKCSDSCSCLPPLRNDTTTYMHQSYKTENQTFWPKGWSLFRNSWLELHKQHDWTFVFWLDKHNDLLAQCTGFGALFQGRGPLQKVCVVCAHAPHREHHHLNTSISVSNCGSRFHLLQKRKADLSRLLYLYVYGGLYADSDYLALQSQIPLLEQHPILKHQQVLLQGRGKQQPVGLEWGYARTPGHAFFVYCLENHIDSHTKSDSAAVYVTGPIMLETCLRTYMGETGAASQPLVPMTTLLNTTGIVIVEPKLIAPIDGHDFESTCGSWRSSNNDHHSWRDDWTTSTCRKELLQQGSFAVTFYTQSWNILDEKEEKEAAAKLEAKRKERKRRKNNELHKKASPRRRQDVYARSGHPRRNSNRPRSEVRL